MANWRKFVGGKTLTAKALGKGKVIGKITSVHVETLKDRSGKENERLCLEIEDQRKLVPLNVGNCTNLEKAYGEDTDDWEGKPVMVTTHKVKFGDEDVDGLLVTAVDTKKRK